MSQPSIRSPSIEGAERRLRAGSRSYRSRANIRPVRGSGGTSGALVGCALVCASAGVSLCVAKPARAQTCPVPDDASPALSSIDGSRRLAFVRSALDEAGRSSNRWGSFWRATFQTAAVTQFAIAHAVEDRADRIDLVAGGVKASVGFVFALVFRLPAERHHDEWADRPWEQGEDTCARLAAAEAALEKDAKFERRARSPGMHALGLSFNFAVSVATYLLHHRLWSTSAAFVSGGLVGEARVFTTPTVATDALGAYRAGKLTETKVSLTPTVVPTPGGAQLGLLLTF